MTAAQTEKHKPIEIYPPLAGEVDSRIPKGHHADSRDLFVLNADRRTLSVKPGFLSQFTGIPVKASSSWEQQVSAPFDGKVIKVVDDEPDRMKLRPAMDVVTQKILGPKRAKGDMNAITGNHIMLRSDDGLTAFFAHLRQGSAIVVEGELVSEGQALAKVGNSGLCLEPHLHFHITDDSEAGQSQPVPFIFRT
ncbi:MAG: M23 family metallopeptidase [Thiotrichales bacterium]